MKSFTSKETFMPTGIVKLHRVLRAKPEKVYRAFMTPDALALAPAERLHLQG